MSRSQRARGWRPPPAPVFGFPRRPQFWLGVLVGLAFSAAILVTHFTGRHSGRVTLWGANTAGVPGRVAMMGLPPAFGTKVHIHQHLDLFVDGKRVVVPAGIGIDPGGRFLVPLHTHDSSGVIHVESPVERGYTLGEFFGVWGVRLTRRCLGRYCANLRVFIDGRRIASDPRRLRLRQHQEIAIVVGTPVPVPSSYDFPPRD
jgi:hypothetical protein